MWSKDNEVVVYAEKSLRFHPFRNGVLLPSQRIVHMEVDDDVLNPSLSPDGQYFVCNYSLKDDRLITVVVLPNKRYPVAQSIKLEIEGSSDVLGWVVVP